MANDTEMRVRFGRVISAIRAVIDSLAAQDAAWEELKKGTVGVYAKSAMACINARQAFEDETPTMDALVIALRDKCYKDPTWQTDGADDVKLLRMAWHSIHKTIEAGKSFPPDALGMMRNLCAALERAAVISDTVTETHEIGRRAPNQTTHEQKVKRILRRLQLHQSTKGETKRGHYKYLNDKKNDPEWSTAYEDALAQFEREMVVKSSSFKD